MQNWNRYIPYSEWRNFGCRITEFIFHGLRCVSLENETIRVSIAADKGADIYELLYKPSDTEILLRTPIGLRSQGPVATSVCLRDGAFLDFYEGGWQELFPCAGDHLCAYKGAQIGMHGEVALLPWSYRIDEDTPEKIVVTFSVRTLRTPFCLDRTMIIERGQSQIEIRETVTNTSSEPMQFMWGHHPAFGWPFVEENCEIKLPKCSVTILAEDLPSSSRLVPQEAEWPFVKGASGRTIDLSIMPGPETQAQDMAFLSNFTEGWYEVKNPRLELGFRLSWDPAIFRYLWFWQVTRGAFGYPWYGQTYNLALEPHSSFPPMLPKAIESKTAVALGGGSTLSTVLKAEFS